MNITLPDEELILTIHEVVLSVSGGKSGIHEQNIIDGVIARPLTYVQYVDDFNIDTICALLIDSIDRNHGFNDANKRTALMTVISTYQMNHVTFRPTSEMNVEFDNTIMWVVNHKPGIEELTRKLKDLRTRFEGHSPKFETNNSFFEMFRRKNGK